MRKAGAFLLATLALGSCDSSPTPAAQAATGQDVILQVESVRLNAVKLPEALITVTNDGDRYYERIYVSCRFLDRAGGLIDVGSGDVENLSSHGQASTHIWSAAQYKTPARATCRVDEAR